MKHDRDISCQSKKEYHTFKEAERAMVNLFRYGEKELHVYKCNYCQNFHVGHKRNSNKWRKKNAKTKV